MEVAGRHDPNLPDRIRRKAIEDIFRRSVSVEAGERAGAEAVDPLSAMSLSKALSGTGARERAEALVGKETLKDIDTLYKSLAGSQQSAEFAAAGGISGGMFMANLLRARGLIHSAITGVQFGTASIILSTPLLNRFATRSAMTKADADKLFISIVQSAPFARALVEDRGVDSAEEFAAQINDALADWAEDNPEEAQQLGFEFE